MKFHPRFIRTTSACFALVVSLASVSQALPVTHTSQIGMGYGTSTNPLRLPGASGSSYFLFEPSTLIEAPLSKRVFALGDISLRTRNYNDEVIEKNAGDLNAQGVVALTAFLDNGLEIGGDAGYSHYNGRDLSLEANSIEGRPNRSNALRSTVYGRRSFGPLYAEARAEFDSLQFQDPTLDEKGFVFNDSRNEFGGRLTGGLEFAGSTTEISILQKDRRYRDRRARFTEGTPSDSLGVLRETEDGLSLQTRFEHRFVDLKAMVAALNTKDRIKGANDALSTDYGAAAAVRPYRAFEFEIGVLFRDSRFKNFAADVLEDPQSTTHRRDRLESHFAVATYEFQSFQTQLRVARDNARSNYSPVAFRDDVMEFSLRTRF